MSDTIRLWENEDWVGELDAGDAAFLAALTGNKVTLRPLVLPIWEVAAGHHIGVLALPSGRRLEIWPKVPVGSVFQMIAVVWGLPPDLRDELSAYDDLSEALEIVAAYFASLVEHQVRQGLYRCYVEQEGNLTAVRGRIQVLQDLRDNHILRHRVFCRFADLTWDVPENQVLRQVVHLLSGAAFSKTTQNRLQLLDWQLAEVSRRVFVAQDLDRLSYHRLNQDYVVLHQFCRLFLEWAGLSEHAGDTQLNTFLVNMNTLFEKFTVQALRRYLPGPWQVEEQVPLPLDVAGAVGGRPDVIVRMGNTWVSLGDCKYKTWTAGDYIHADLYQVVAYCVAAKVERGFLFYPSSTDRPDHTLHIVNSTVQLNILSIDLSVSGQHLDRACQSLADRVARHLPSSATRPATRIA